jgi:hypothetical protein
MFFQVGWLYSISSPLLLKRGSLLKTSGMEKVETLGAFLDMRIRKSYRLVRKSSRIVETRAENRMNRLHLRWERRFGVAKRLAALYEKKGG